MSLWVIIILCVVAALAFSVLVDALLPSPPEEEHSIGYHSAYGTHYVLYPDGRRSQPFLKGTAHSYAEMFGGEVKQLDRR